MFNWYKKESPILSMLGIGGGIGSNLIGGASLVTYSMTKSSSHDNYNEGTGLTSGVCSGSNRAVVSHASTTTVTMTLTFTPAITTPITSWNICTANAGANGFDINYRFNDTGYNSSGISGNTATSLDLTSQAQSAGTISTFQLRGGNGTGNTHIYLFYLEINGVYLNGVGSPEHTWSFTI